MIRSNLEDARKKTKRRSVSLAPRAFKTLTPPKKGAMTPAKKRLESNAIGGHPVRKSNVPTRKTAVKRRIKTVTKARKHKGYAPD